MPYKKLSSFFQNLRNRHFLIIDFFICIFTPFLALFLRLDGNIDFDIYGKALIFAILIFTPVKMVIFYLFDLYRRFWKTASIDELARLIYIGANVVLIQSFIFIILRSIKIFPLNNLPFSFPFVDGLLAILLVSTLRFSVRLFNRIDQRRINLGNAGSFVIIIGAGAAGTAIVEEMQKNNQLKMTPVAFLDDDPEKIHLRIRGVPVLGPISDLSIVANKFNINKIVIAIPTAPGKKIREIVDTANENKLESMTVPGIYEILGGKVDIAKLRKIEIEDLLRRRPIRTDTLKVNQFLLNKVVMVTGAGGSIGGELSRQILKANPSKLLIIGHGENSIFEIEDELRYLKKHNYERIPIKSVIVSRIADIKDKERLGIIFNEFKPEVVFHAAAHKHVPLMENNPSEVISNNLKGTKNLIDCSVKYGVENFILISTDKAVNSTNLMGVSKRVAEMMMLKTAKENNLNFKAVRFGNVLGSRGSVVRTFRKQLERGGPITITHPEIKRYFMTIPEAVQLVLQASVLGKGGEIFVFDMGEPVKIVDLAKDLIKLAGLELGADIDIEFTGLRPGEKMFEELFKDGEIYIKTEHEKIMFAKNSSEFIPSNLIEKVNYLIDNSNNLSPIEIIQTFKEIVPEFTHQNFDSLFHFKEKVKL